MKFRTLQLEQQSYSKTQLKQEGQQIKTEFGNLSTSRTGYIKQFVTDDDTEKIQFKKLQDLEFQNGLFKMQMQYNLLRQGNIFINEKIVKISQSEKNQHKFNRKFKAFKINLNRMKVSKVILHHRVILPYLNILTKSIFIIELSQDQILKNFKELFEVCNANEKLTVLAKQYCGSLQSVQIEVMTQQYHQIIESLIKMIIDIIKKFNSIRIDALKIKQGTPDKQQYNFEFGTFNKEQRKTLLTNESPAFQSTSELEEMKQKLSDHYEKIDIQQPIREPQRKSVTSHIQRKRIDIIPSLRSKAKKIN